MFAELHSKQETKFNALHAAMTEIKAQNSEIQNSIDFISNKYDEVLQKMNQLQDEVGKNKEHIKNLENKVEYLEKNSRSATIEIRNIPLQPNENQSKLSEVVKKIGDNINYQINDGDIRNIYRIKPKKSSPNPAAIVVDFTTCTKKFGIIKATREHNKNNPNGKLSTTHLDISGPPRAVYIDEQLTSYTSRLYYLVRIFAKENNFDHRWTHNGNIYLRERDGSPALLVKEEGQLKQLRTEKLLVYITLVLLHASNANSLCSPLCKNYSTQTINICSQFENAAYYFLILQIESLSYILCWLLVIMIIFSYTHHTDNYILHTLNTHLQSTHKQYNTHSNTRFMKTYKLTLSTSNAAASHHVTSVIYHRNTIAVLSVYPLLVSLS